MEREPISQAQSDRRLVEAARATIHDAATLLFDVERRAPRMFAARLRMLVTEMEEVAHELANWEDLPKRYADTPADTPPRRT